MNIAFLVNSVGFGGASKMATFVANSLGNRGHKVCLISLMVGDLEIHQKINSNIHIHQITQKSQYTIIQYAIWLKHIIRILRKEKSEVVISFVSTPNFINAILNKITNIPSIISERGNPFEAYKDNKLINKLIVYSINHSTGAVFQTKEAAQFYSKALQKRSCIIPNPIFINENIPEFDYNNMPHTIVFLGRFDNYQKRLDVLLESFKKFHNSHPDYKLILYGTGPDQYIIENFCKDSKLDFCIEIKGLSTSSMHDIAKEGIFVITSDFEGISNSLLEALAIGMPVVSIDHAPGGGRLLIQDHVNGILTPTGNPDAVAIAMSEFADNPELCKQCGNEAKKVLIRFAPERIIDTWENYIMNITNAK